MRLTLIVIFFFSIISKGFTQKTFLALGDSYTIGESVDEEGRWPVQLSEKLNSLGYTISAPKIIAKTGWRTDQLKNAIESADLQPPYDLVGLLIGVNNQYQGRSVESYRPEFEELLQMSIKLAGGDKTKVFVVSIPDYGYTPFGESKKATISVELDAYNTTNKEIANKYEVKYYYITDISRSKESGLVADDNLHPSAKQYSLWVNRILEDSEFLERLR